MLLKDVNWLGAPDAPFEARVKVRSMRPPVAATVTGDCALPTVLPCWFVRVVCTIRPACVADSFATRVRTETLAARLEASSVVTNTPQ